MIRFGYMMEIVFHQRDQHFEAFIVDSWPPIRFYLVKASGGRVVSFAGRVVLEFELWTSGKAEIERRERHTTTEGITRFGWISRVLGVPGEKTKPRNYGVLPRSGKRPKRIL